MSPQATQWVNNHSRTETNCYCTCKGSPFHNATLPGVMSIELGDSTIRRKPCQFLKRLGAVGLALVCCWGAVHSKGAYSPGLGVDCRSEGAQRRKNPEGRWPIPTRFFAFGSEGPFIPLFPAVPLLQGMEAWQHPAQANRTKTGLPPWDGPGRPPLAPLTPNRFSGLKDTLGQRTGRKRQREGG